MFQKPPNRVGICCYYTEDCGNYVSRAPVIIVQSQPQAALQTQPTRMRQGTLYYRCTEDKIGYLQQLV